jgi:hypothetical protein
MKSLDKVRWMMVTMLIIMALGFAAYRSGQVTRSKAEMCSTNGKESDSPKMRTALPMWESLSRHLITLHR